MKLNATNTLPPLISVLSLLPAETFVLTPAAPSRGSVEAPRPQCQSPALMPLQASKGSAETETEQLSDGNDVLEDLFFREADAIFDTIDVNDDGEISNDELHTHLVEKGYPSDSIRMLFTALDKNADGIISREEMRYAFSNYEISAMYRAFGLGNKLDCENDISNDNEECDIEKEQVYDDAVSKIRSKAMSDANKYSPEMLTKLADTIFDMIDIDGSGVIDAMELRMHFAEEDEQSTATVIRNVGKPSIASVNSILKALDINSDGVISREEMRKGFQEYDPRALSSALGLQVSRTAET